MTALSWVSLPLHTWCCKKSWLWWGGVGLSSKGHFQIADLNPNIMTLAKVSCSIVYYGLHQPFVCQICQISTSSKVKSVYQRSMNQWPVRVSSFCNHKTCKSLIKKLFFFSVPPVYQILTHSLHFSVQFTSWQIRPPATSASRGTSAASAWSPHRWARLLERPAAAGRHHHGRLLLLLWAFPASLLHKITLRFLGIKYSPPAVLPSAALPGLSLSCRKQHRPHHRCKSPGGGGLIQRLPLGSLMSWPVLLMTLASGWSVHAGHAVRVRGVAAPAQRGRRPRGDDAQRLAPAAGQTQRPRSHQGCVPPAGEKHLTSTSRSTVHVFRLPESPSLFVYFLSSSLIRPPGRLLPHFASRLLPPSLQVDLGTPSFPQRLLGAVARRQAAVIADLDVFLSS